jgi:hypothetical protein
MPSWEHFRELCALCFVMAFCGTRLAKLACLPFMSTDQDYANHCNIVLCHARNLSTIRKLTCL